jgi:ATP-dependent DNA helicase RecQ
MVRDPLAALERYFGFREFRDGQEPVVSALLSGRDALVVMPTGGGKSLCYQLPALVKEGVTLVVSPLIALMKDQVDALVARGIPAAMINSTQSLEEQRDRLRQLRAGELKLVYIAPERFRAEGFRAALREVEIALFAVDEAHCLSQWGHDFRPDYLRLEQTLEELGHPQTAAFTATATPHVRDDILKTLRLRDPFVSVTGFERPNLSLRVRQVESQKAKIDLLAGVVREWKTGIVYCATRKRVEEIAERLQELGHSVIAYHGGMDDRAREFAQNAFLGRDADIVVATNAFGMGIDRSDVRFVVHFEVPGSIEAYYQEAGRAGRDREPAVCELLFNYADTATQEFFLEGNNPDPVTIRNVYSALLSHADEQHVVLSSIQDLAEWAGARNAMAVGSAISTLTRAGYLERFDVPGQRVRGTRLLRPDTSAFELELDEAALRAKAKADRGKLEAMVRFCYDDRCRQQWILRYFGEAAPEECGNCDRCLAEAAADRRAPDAAEALLVRKALSGVARMCRKGPRGWEGRFGRGRIIQMLLGSRAAEITEKGLHELSTHGLLKEEGQGYLYALFKELETAGLVRTEPGEYRLLAITPRGVEVMKGATDYQLSWPPRAPAGTRARERGRTGSGSDGGLPLADLRELGFDPVLYEKLKAKRAELAAAEGGKPAFTVFGNQTLELFTRLQPTTMEAGLAIRGVGPAKAARYLAEFLQVIAAHRQGMAEKTG